MEHRALNVDLDEIIVFTTIVELGSFSAASARLGIPKSTASRRISDLEARVGARLLQRTTRKLSLTDVGRVYYEHCSRIVAELEEAHLAVTQLQSTPRGLLRVTTPLTFSVLGPILAEYMALYPDVRLDLLCTDRRVDLVEERFDLAIRAGRPRDSAWVARRLGTVRRFLVAAPEAIERLGPLKEPADLQRIPSLVFAPDGNTWRLVSGGKSLEMTVRPRLAVNDYDMLRAVVLAGFGVALLPEYQCAEELKAGRLRRVLDAWAAAEVPVFALYPSTRHLSPKVIALLDLLRNRLVLADGPART
ncbi:LysR family transcriptional regulator [Polyangium jinanense]|uniref:LysR family transcriptional regulator n=1 Tax=Polyangium jinanense TaxID=2829994 RepID=A0A9X4AVF9_9BACT|nr:LysR family transcriptional regulator [Polyangium jinanense]MDC3960010.1 LysR family transcriptional regulator [Polyangium jinanense]MDC3986228.1 LysR family transcriptional regulator [Polyangium jinanense]